MRSLSRWKVMSGRESGNPSLSAMAWFARMASRVFLFCFVMQECGRDEKPVPLEGNERCESGSSQINRLDAQCVRPGFFKLMMYFSSLTSDLLRKACNKSQAVILLTMFKTA